MTDVPTPPDGLRVATRTELLAADAEAGLTGNVYLGVRQRFIAGYHLQLRAEPVLGVVQDVVAARLVRDMARQWPKLPEVRVSRWTGGWQTANRLRITSDILVAAGAYFEVAGTVYVTATR